MSLVPGCERPASMSSEIVPPDAKLVLSDGRGIWPLVAVGHPVGDVLAHRLVIDVDEAAVELPVVLVPYPSSAAAACSPSLRPESSPA
jgi:hypothetical protein